MTGLANAMYPHPLIWSSDFRTALMVAVPISIVLWSGIFAVAVQL